MLDAGGQRERERDDNQSNYYSSDFCLQRGRGKDTKKEKKRKRAKNGKMK